MNQDRYARVTQLQDDPEPWDAERIAAELDIQPITVGTWRSRTLQFQREQAPVPLRFDVLPVPDHPDAGPRTPLWKAGTIRRWAMQTGRMDPHGAPRHVPRRGRPKKTTTA